MTRRNHHVHKRGLDQDQGHTQATLTVYAGSGTRNHVKMAVNPKFVDSSDDVEMPTNVKVIASFVNPRTK